MPAQPGSVGAIIAAAGQSRRFGEGDKLFAPLAGRPLILHTLIAFEVCRAVDRVVLVLAAESLERGRRLVEAAGFDKVAAVCPGGPRRRDSVRLGLEALGRRVKVFPGSPRNLKVTTAADLALAQALLAESGEG